MAADKLLNIEIITPQKIVYSGNAISISLPGALSPFQVLYNHAPIVSNLNSGKIKIVEQNNETLVFKTGTGFVEVRNNKVSILVDSASVEK